MLLPHAPEVALAEVGAEERGPLEEQASAIPTAEIVRLVEALGTTLGRIKRGGEPKLEVELTFLKLARDYTEPPVDALLRRLETLERAVESGVAAKAAATMEVPASASASASRPTEGTTRIGVPGVPDAAEASAESAASEEARPAPALRWGEVMAALKGRRQALTAAVYGDARVEGFDGEVLTISFPEDKQFQVGMARERKHVDELRKVLEELVGSQPRLEVTAGGGDAGDASAAEEHTAGRGVPPEAREVRAAPVERNSVEAPEMEASLESAPWDEPSRGAGGTDVNGGPDTGASGVVEQDLAGGEGGADDKIHDEREVFRMAQERLGLFGQGGER
jgi:DNA polymerase-3 subunit gamma/tau